jgi:DNA-cytosine methyltransferase
MNKLTLRSFFTGIGAIEKGFEKANIPIELKSFCEIDEKAVKSYCSIFNEDINKNLGDINKLNMKGEYSDIICGGSPCQDFSISGKKNGSVWTCNKCGHEYNPIMQHYDNRDACPNCGEKDISKTRSSLLVEFLRMIREINSNYVIFENVKNITGKEFKPVFDKFLEELNEYGYNTYWDILNSKDFGVPQSRERVYVIGIKKEIDNGEFKFPKGNKSDVKLKDILEKEVDSRYIVKKHINERMTKNYMQYDNSGKGYNSQAARAYYLNGYMCTLPKCNGGDKTQILIDEENDIVRRITPLEAWRLTGFSDEDYYKAEASGQTMGSLYGQAGNSIVVDVIEAILKNLFK